MMQLFKFLLQAKQVLYIIYYIKGHQVYVTSKIYGPGGDATSEKKIGVIKGRTHKFNAPSLFFKILQATLPPRISIGRFL